MKLKWLFLLTIALLANAARADMFCPTNFNSIKEGDSIAAVIAACGKPDSQASNNKKANQPQEWTYYLANQSTPAPTRSVAGSTMKMTVAFDASGKAINISVNGSGMPQTAACGSQIQLGDAQDAVTNACGKPAYINQSQEAQNASVPETEITELTYNASPTVVLVFVNGRLSQRK